MQAFCITIIHTAESFFEILLSPELLKKFPHLVEIRDSLASSQQLTTCHCSELN